MKILFIGNEERETSRKALEFLKTHFLSHELESYMKTPSRPEAIPDELKWWRGDYILSLQTRWKLPGYILNSASKGAINFHVGCPNYPGACTVNWALWEQAKEFGVTAHFMDEKIDAGPIIQVLKFPIWLHDNVESLLARSYDYLMISFYEICRFILQDIFIQVDPSLKWERKPFKKAQLDELMDLTFTDEYNFHRAIQATEFGDWRPFIRKHGKKFELVPQED